MRAFLQNPEEIIYLAAGDYRPQPYRGRVLLFRRELRLAGRYEDPHFGWGGLVQDGLEVVDVAGDHMVMFLEPSDQSTAGKLIDGLDKALMVAANAAHPGKYPRS